MSFASWCRDKNLTESEKEICEKAYKAGFADARKRKRGNEYLAVLKALFEPRSGNFGFDSVRYKGDLLVWYYKDVCICIVDHDCMTLDYDADYEKLCYGKSTVRRVEKAIKAGRSRGYKVSARAWKK